MNKLLFIFLLLSSTYVSAQQDSKKGQDDKYDEIMSMLKFLQTEIDNLENRLDRMERISGLNKRERSYKELKQINESELEKWKKLDVNKSKKYVIDLIGLPLEKQDYNSGGITEKWNYEYEGFITFNNDKVYRWRIPKNLQ